MFHAFAENVPAIAYVDDVDDRRTTLYISPFVERMLGYTVDEWLDPDLWAARLHPDDREQVLAEVARTNAGGGAFSIEYRMISRDGRVVWVHDDAVLVRDEATGEPRWWVGLVVDATARKHAEAGLKEADLRYRALVEQIPAITYTDVADEHMTTMYISPQVETLLGFTPQEWISQPDLWRRQLHPDDRERAHEEYLRGRDRGVPFAYEYRMISRDGRVVWFRDDAVVLRDDAGAPRFVHGVMLDITERRKAEQQAAFLAYHDKLTGLPNRAMFEDLLGRALARARRHDLAVAALSLDLNDFKLVNDSLGHDAGDRLLCLVADRLAEATRETDLVARQGGDEFLLLLADLERGTERDDTGPQLVAESVASRIEQLLATPFDLDGEEVFVSASIGISLYPSVANDARTLLQTADAAMHRSKKNGPGTPVVFSRDDSNAVSRLSMATRLRKAVEHQNWVLHYQPIVDLDGGTPLEVEALVRWQDPNGGLVPPGEFIPLAEEMGLIESIGDWVLRELCRQARMWRAEGIELGAGFNLSPRQLWQPALAGRILASLEAEGVEPSRVLVEVTESTVMTDPDRTVRILRELSSHGLRIAIDDFGTGYSSLARLKSMPVDVLKIDRSFVRDIPGDRDSCSMVRAIVQMADSLGMTPLAEGIETEEQRRFLLEQGCHVGQGFHFSRPVPAEEIAALVSVDRALASGAAE